MDIGGVLVVDKLNIKVLCLELWVWIWCFKCGMRVRLVEDMIVCCRKGWDSDGVFVVNGVIGRVFSVRSVCLCWDCIGIKFDFKGSIIWMVVDLKVGMFRIKEGLSVWGGGSGLDCIVKDIMYVGLDCIV